MRPLVEMPDSNEEHQDLLNLLLANGIRYQERQSSFLMPAAIWVEESDYAKAMEIASSVGARHAKLARSEWDREWSVRYKGSYFRWLLAKTRRSSNLLQLLLLIFIAGLFVIYPIVYIVRRAL